MDVVWLLKPASGNLPGKTMLTLKREAARVDWIQEDVLYRWLRNVQILAIRRPREPWLMVLPINDELLDGRLRSLVVERRSSLVGSDDRVVAHLKPWRV